MYPKIVVITPTKERYHRSRPTRDVDGYSYEPILRIDNIPRCKASVQAQTYPGEVQHVIGQDVDRFAATFRNHVIDTTDAPLVAYCDDDCYMEPDHLFSLYVKMVRYSADFVFSGSKIRTYSGYHLFSRCARHPAFCRIDTNEILHKRRLCTFTHWQSRDNNDWILVNHWLINGAIYAATEQPTSNYTLGPGFATVAKYAYSQAKHKLFG